MLKIDNKRVTKNLPITKMIGEDQKEYLTLPANMEKGIVSYAFKLKWRDVLKVIFKRRIYFYQVRFGKGLQPIHANVSRKNFEEYRQYAVNDFGIKKTGKGGK